MSPHRPSRSNDESRRKGVLFCPDCRHESDIDGDWNLHTDGDECIYECPDCEATVTKRPRAAPALAP